MVYRGALLISVLFVLRVINTKPISHIEDDRLDGDKLSSAPISEDGNRKQIIMNRPEWHNDMPPYSEGVFDPFGHHLCGPVAHMEEHPVNMDVHVPCRIHHHQHQFHAPDIDYWWPHHWPHHLPPPFPFHKNNDDKKKDKKKEKEKEKEKKKGKKPSK